MGLKIYMNFSIGFLVLRGAICLIYDFFFFDVTGSFKGSLAVKVSEPTRMSPRILIDREADILVGSFTLEVSESERMSLFQPIRGQIEVTRQIHRHRS